MPGACGEMETAGPAEVGVLATIQTRHAADGSPVGGEDQRLGGSSLPQDGDEK